MKRRSVAFAVVMLFIGLTLGCRSTPPQTPTSSPKSSGDSNAAEWFDNGLAFFRQQRYAEAIAAWNKVSAAKPEQPIVYYNRGLAWYLSGTPRKAIDDFNRAIALKPDYVMAIYNRGFAWSALNAYNEALQDYQRVIELAPEYVDAYYQSAWIQALCPDERYRNGPGAVHTMQRAVELNPDTGYYDLLAAAYAEAGRFDDAVDTQNMVILWLKKEGKTEQLDRYVQRLQVYQQGKSLRTQTHAEAARASQPAASEKQPPAPTEKTTARPAAAACGYPYCIHLSSYRSAEKAARQAQQLRRNGSPAFTSPVWLGDKGTWYRVFSGYFNRIETAREAARDLKQNQFDYARVMRLPYALQVARSSSDQELERVESGLAAKGYLAYRVPDMQADDSQRLLVGAFESAQEANDWLPLLLELDVDPQAVCR